jgi:glutathione S-transferase
MKGDDFAYEPHTINLRAGETRRPDYTSIAPHEKIPSILDPHAPGGQLAVFESGAILLYLAGTSTPFRFYLSSIGALIFFMLCSNATW